MHRSWFAVATCSVALAGTLAAAATSSCGTFRGEDDPADGGGEAATIESGVDGDGRADAGADGPSERRCAPNAPFGNVTPVAWALPHPLSSMRGPAADGLTYVTKGDGSGSSLGAFRVALDETIGTDESAKISAVSTEGDQQPATSADGLVVWFVSRRTNSTKKLWRSERATVADDFGGPVPAPVKHDSVAEGPSDVVQDPYVAGDRIFFVFEKDGVTKTRVICSAQARKDVLDATCLSLPGAASDEHPVVTADGNELFFGRVGPNDKSEIFHSVKDGSGKFGPPVSSKAIAGSDLKPTWISPDACTLYYFDETGAGAKLVKQSRTP